MWHQSMKQEAQDIYFVLVIGTILLQPSDIAATVSNTVIIVCPYS